jgi:hypothetical protein
MRRVTVDRLFRLAVFCFLFGGGIAHAQEKPTVAGEPKAFRGPTGEVVTLVFLEPMEANRVLIAFDGVDGEWNGKVLLHRREAQSGREDYRLAGQTYVSLAMRYGRFEAYPKGAHDDLALKYSKNESDKADAARIVARYSASAMSGVPKDRVAR